uniref:Protein argonaute MEL1 n=1 Tax=Anthurium amnicola TaxID=1678845 RepID=A0A1D1XV91_9ARAE
MEVVPSHKFVPRPGVGRIGVQTRVRSNYFPVTLFPRDNIIQYDVTITPDVPPKLNRIIFARFVERSQGGPIGDFKLVYDGRKIAFAPKVLPFGQAGTFDVELDEDDAPTARKRPPRLFKVKLRQTGAIVMEELLNFLNGRSSLTPNCQMAITALDVLIRHKPSTLHNTVGRSIYTPQGSRPLSRGIEVWQGYYQSARPTTGRMMINIDLSATAFYEGGPLIQLVTKILDRRSPEDLRRGFSERDRQKVERVIKSLRIKDNHRDGSRKFKIEKLTPTPASHTMFDKGDGTQDSVQNYFNQVYNRRLNYPFFPCIVVRKNVYLPMEVCDVIPGQRYPRKLDEKQTADMIKFTCQRPDVRANKIQAGYDILHRGNEYLQHFGMRISNEMAVVNARVLPAPTIQYSNSSARPDFGAWSMRDMKLATGSTLGSWSVVAFMNENELPNQVINNFLRELINSCQQAGMNVPNRTPPIMYANIQGNTEETLKQAWIKAGNVAKAQPQLIVCILPYTGMKLYAEIKRITDTVIGVSSQCIQSKHARQAKRQYCVNVCLKINVKLGGMNAFLDREHLPFISEVPTIVMGADVTHPGPGDRNTPSITSVCASMDARASRYAATIRVQEARTEIIADLANMTKELLKTFYQTCGRKPDRILFYRDGVSEGQFGHVMTNEINAVRAACQALDANYKPKITFVIVQKRHHTRFFPMDRRTDKSGNCLPGTVVETEITHPFEFDFYLQSHAGIQGTSRPAHYHVLYDQNGLDSDKLQTLSYNLCHLYARCTRAVSMVPPVYYAHLVCVRAKCHTREHWSDTESSEGSVEPTFGVVKPELQRVMYFM